MKAQTMNERETADNEFPFFIQHPEVLEQLEGFLTIQRVYSAAIKEVTTKLEILNDSFQSRRDHNPIHHMGNRLKTPQSIVKKLKRNGWEMSIDSIRENVLDVAGVRVVCCYIEDIYALAELFLAQNDVVLIKKKDYIAHPKDNGYRSLHLVVRIPVFLPDRVEQVPVEIQIRTVAMDFWASLEHQLRYKKDRTVSPEINRELLDCAETIATLDRKMQALYKQL